MAGRTHFRRLDGLLLLDKPQGMSSNAALQAARRLFRAEKGGHTGSLDPLATGLLPLCFGEATKIAGLLLGSRKAYDTVAVLGTTTDTDDADGTPLRERPVPPLDMATVQAALAPLLGRIRQPTRVVHGADDPLVPPAAGQDLAQRIAGATLDLVPGMGHDLPLALLPRLADGIALAARTPTNPGASTA